MKSNFNQQFQQQVQRQQQQRRQQGGYVWQQEQNAKRQREEMLRQQAIQKPRQQQHDQPFTFQHDQPVHVQPTPQKDHGFFYPVKWAFVYVVYVITLGIMATVGIQILGAIIGTNVDAISLILAIPIAFFGAIALTNKALN